MRRSWLACRRRLIYLIASGDGARVVLFGRTALSVPSDVAYRGEGTMAPQISGDSPAYFVVRRGPDRLAV